MESFFRVTLVPGAYYRRPSSPAGPQARRTVANANVARLVSSRALRGINDRNHRCHGPTYWPRDTSNRSIAGYYYASPCCSTGRPTNNTPRAFSNEPAGRARDRILARDLRFYVRTTNHEAHTSTIEPSCVSARSFVDLFRSNARVFLFLCS